MRHSILLAVGLLACGGSSAQRSSVPPPAAETPFCVGELCTRPDHIVARRSSGGSRGRCSVMLWDGSATPPIAQLGVAERVPSRPGVLIVFDLPSLRDELVFSIASPTDAPRAPNGATITAMRVDAFSQIAVTRTMPEGQIVVTKEGADVVLQVLVFGRATKVSIPHASDACTDPMGASQADTPVWPNAK